MAVDNAWEARQSRPAADSGAIISRPRLGAADLILQLWRAKGLMILVGLVTFLPALMFALTMPTKYESSAGLLISLGEEQVYRPRVGSEAAGAIPDQELLNQAELELMRSPEVAESVLEKFSLEQLYPEILEDRFLIAKENPGRDPMVKMKQLAVKELLTGFGVEASPKSNVIRASFIHKDPEMSAEVLNAIIDSYLEYRAKVYLSTRSVSFGEQRMRFERDLTKADNAIRQFLEDNKITDFEAERLAAQTLYAAVSDEEFKVSARATAVQGQLETLSRQMQETAPLVDIFVEDSTDQTLLNLNIEREQALSKYKPDSRTVKAIDKQIEQVEAYLATQSNAVGTRRTGPNPVYQDMEQRRAGLEAEATSLANQRRELSRQKFASSSRLGLFADLLPDLQELRRQRDLMERNLASYAEREIQSQTLTEIARQETDNIRVIERARVPLTGSSMKLPLIALAFLFASTLALIVGLLRATTRQAFSTAGSVERTTGIPVIASVPKR